MSLKIIIQHLLLFHSLFPISLGLQQLTAIEKVVLNNRLTRIKEDTKHKFSDIICEKPGSEHVIFIFPGAGGPDQFTEELEQKLVEESTKTKMTTTVKTLDWQEFRGSLLTASYDGEAFGESISSLLWEHDSNSDNLRMVHCIGISVGGFAANACITELYRRRLGCQQEEKEKPYLRLTLLDPFTSRGVFGAGYGDQYFGSSVDYAEQYLNTDDPVPTTNEPLPLCACIDVTGAPERNAFELPPNESMHCWPLVYFARYGSTNSAGKLLLHGKDGNPLRGTVTKL